MGHLSFTTRNQWRSWLKTHHHQAKEALLVLYKKGTRTPSLALAEAQEEALCFGWIDHISRSIDGSRYSLRFTPRRAGSIWSITNIRRVRRLIEAGLMTEAGLQKVREAQQNGQWEAAIAREQTDLLPTDLEKALRRRKGALAAYRRLNNSRKKQLLHWLLTAKSQETRRRRLEAIIREVAG